MKIDRSCVYVAQYRSDDAAPHIFPAMVGYRGRSAVWMDKKPVAPLATHFSES